MIYFLRNSRIRKLNYGGRDQISGCLWEGEDWRPA